MLGKTWLQRLRAILAQWDERTTTRSSSSDVVYIDSAGRVVAHHKSLKVERLTFL